MFGVWVVRIEGEPDLARRWAYAGFVFVGHVHEVVAEGVVIVVLESARCELSGDEVDMGLGETCASAFTQMFNNSRRAPKTNERARRRRCCRTHFERGVRWR